MIVRTAGDALHLITQPDHAALARRIMEHWVADDFARAPRRATILDAIEQHDNGWLELDSAPVVLPSGKIADFLDAPIDRRRAVWPRGVARLAGDPWVAALVAQHAIHVYRRHETDPDWQPFFSEMAHLRERFVAESDLDQDTLEADYRFVRIGDLLSLTFCNGWTETLEHDGYQVRYEAPDLIVTPDPFQGERIPIAVAARATPNRPYVDGGNALECWLAAPSIAVTGHVAGGQSR